MRFTIFRRTRPKKKTIYASDNNNIFAIDAQTFSVTNLGNPDIGTIYALGYNTIVQKLFAIGAGGLSGNGDFVRFDDLLNLTNNTLVSRLHDQGVKLVSALAFDEANNRFFGSATNSPFRSLISIDASTGIASTIGSFGLGNSSVNGLALVEVSAPSSILLLGISIALVGFSRRKNRINRVRSK